MAETALPKSGDITQGPYGHGRKWFAVIEGDLARIPLTRGFVATIDLADLELVGSHSWSVLECDHTAYALTQVRRRTLMMHALILGVSAPLIGDHEDRDGLNNRRNNLTACTRKDNNRRRVSLDKLGKPKFKGAPFHRQSGLYHARITVDGKTISLRYHKTQEEAARAYDAAAIKYFGEFGLTNEELGLYD